MSPQTFIFIGRSGRGKGTQAELLQKRVKEKDQSSEIFYLETGAYFREFLRGEKYSNKLANEIYKKGERQPDFLAVHIWSHILIGDFKGTEHAFFDGICRSLPEATTFTTALEFYGRKAIVIYLNVSREWSEERLLLRGRADDKSKEEIKKPLENKGRAENRKGTCRYCREAGMVAKPLTTVYTPHILCIYDTSSYK